MRSKNVLPSKNLSPPSLPKRGTMLPPLKKGELGGFHGSFPPFLKEMKRGQVNYPISLCHRGGTMPPPLKKGD